MQQRTGEDHTADVLKPNQPPLSDCRRRLLGGRRPGLRDLMSGTLSVGPRRDKTGQPETGKTDQVVQASDREAKLFAVRKFAKTSASTEQRFLGLRPACFKMRSLM